MKLLILILTVAAMVGGVIVGYQISRLNQIFPSVIARLFFAALVFLFISRAISLIALFSPGTLRYVWVASSILFCLIIGCFAWAIKILADGWRELKN